MRWPMACGSPQASAAPLIFPLAISRISETRSRRIETMADRVACLHDASRTSGA